MHGRKTEEEKQIHDIQIKQINHEKKRHTPGFKVKMTDKMSDTISGWNDQPAVITSASWHVIIEKNGKLFFLNCESE